jgi:hypothetical protein
VNIFSHKNFFLSINLNTAKIAADDAKEEEIIYIKLNIL